MFPFALRRTRFLRAIECAWDEHPAENLRAAMKKLTLTVKLSIMRAIV